MTSLLWRFKTVRSVRLPSSGGIGPVELVVAEVDACQVGQVAQLLQGSSRRADCR